MDVSARLRPALVVPDETTWTMAGEDPAALRIAPVATAEAADAVLAPARVPAALAAALGEEWRRAGGLRRVEADAVVLRGAPLATVLSEEQGGGAGTDGGGRGEHGGGDGEHGGHGEQSEHGGHGEQSEEGGHDHGDGEQSEEGSNGEGHDMMAIVGDPSADGLVMEAIDLRFGPLSAVLPGGLTIAVSLDGDVVAAAVVRAGLRSGRDAAAEAPDPLTPVTWAVADLVAREVAAGTPAPAREQWERLAAVELERALSHVAWVRSLARVLGWPGLLDAAQAAVRALLPLHGLEARPAPAALDAARAALAPVARLAGGRRFA
ncbi:MAG: hypothetical protein ACR2GL_02000, partial [Thermoleophilaceae bacterium]